MWFWPLHIHLVLFLMLSLAFGGCSKPWVTVVEYPRSVTGIEAGDGITVVLDFESGSPQEAEELEKKIGDCISDAMVKRNLAVRFILPGEFRQVVFPDMDITSAPRGGDWILLLLSSSQIRDKIKSLNLRYLITVRERTLSTHSFISEGSKELFLYGLRVHEKSTLLVADIIDLQKASDSGEVRVSAKDSGYYGCVTFFPVVIPASTESRACKTLGGTVTKFLLGEKNDELSK